MSGHNKLGRKTSIRLSILRNLTTQLIVSGYVVTTVDRAKEVRSIAEGLISDAAKEVDNFSTREILTSSAKLDGKGKKILTEKTSVNDRKYYVVERELKTKEVQVDDSSRLAVRRRMMKWLVRGKDAEGNVVNPVNVLFNDVAHKYRDRKGGYTRIIQLGARRGDSAEMCRLELV